WRDMAVVIEYRQVYLGLDKERTVRVRIAGDQAFLTIKGKTNGISRMEYEYPIPVEDAIGFPLDGQECLITGNPYPYRPFFI
ncbi:MAG: hypothetical protein KJ985_15225, partial [Proteobacteria bacterium]|nr:hypothetical protein [Pseudomonadota bacterium]